MISSIVQQQETVAVGNRDRMLPDRRQAIWSEIERMLQQRRKSSPFLGRIPEDPLDCVGPVIEGGNEVFAAGNNLGMRQIVGFFSQATQFAQMRSALLPGCDPVYCAARDDAETPPLRCLVARRVLPSPLRA